MTSTDKAAAIHMARYRCGRCSSIRAGTDWRGSKRLKPWGIVCPECVAKMAAKTAAGAPSQAAEKR